MYNFGQLKFPCGASNLLGERETFTESLKMLSLVHLYRENLVKKT